MMNIFYITLKNVEILYYWLIIGETFMLVCLFLNYKHGFSPSVKFGLLLF